jgi:hypothetical protein
MLDAITDTWKIMITAIPNFLYPLCPEAHDVGKDEPIKGGENARRVLSLFFGANADDRYKIIVL